MSYLFIGIDHVQLAAPSGCEEEARAFFGELLGMAEIRKPEALRKRGGVWFQCGAQQLHIGVQSDFIPSKKAHPGFVVQQLESLKERLRENGVVITEDSQRDVEGVSRFFCEDPFGNRIEFMEVGRDG
ncbi:VOC family protein [Paenibacillus sp. HB172176]|uniref:VOC family protein n=1 Tax=Paenibacillus sp. HB172176 TaxID=2493690 RepID=UPI001439E356|nr:VOC family protein [Paenibacillus sp. HB172176]